MTEVATSEEARNLIERRFADEGIEIAELSVRRYPEETIFVVLVPEHDLDTAARLANEIDAQLSSLGFEGFVTVRRQPDEQKSVERPPRVVGVHDERATELVRLLQARSRASEAQPSLAYVHDSAASIAKATAPRHYLLFGRRGAGKTALLVEAKQRVQRDSALTVWMNMQPYRWQPFERAATAILHAIVDQALLVYSDQGRSPSVANTAAEMAAELEARFARQGEGTQYVRELVPRFHRFLRRFLETTGRQLFVFLDDFYFVPRDQQVELLDVLHACVRDCDAWLKVATIRHLTRWFEPSHQLGLQLGHDADVIDLDVTLEDPSRAKRFLEAVLREYSKRAGVSSITSIFSATALDRLVLASGAVPRDHLLLSSEAILKAQVRSNARVVGVQDVNRAAGDAAMIKLQELDEDLTPDSDWAQTTRVAFSRLLQFCVDETRWTYLRVDHRDRDAHPLAYDKIASLMDLRLIHLLNASVSEEHRAGEKSEAYLLDLSQYSGDRLKRYLHVLDFEGRHLVLKETGRQTETRVGDTPRRLIQILRRAPRFDLAELESS